MVIRQLVTDPVVAFLDRPKGVEEVLAIRVILENSLFPVPAGGRMIRLHLGTLCGVDGPRREYNRKLIEWQERRLADAIDSL